MHIDSPSFKVGNLDIGKELSTKFIAEIGLNHDGKIEQAEKLIIEASKSGADIAKFQMIIPERLFAEYQENQFSGKGLIDFFKKYEFPDSWLPRLKKCCSQNNVEFLVTPFYEEAVDKLERIGVNAYKIASFELWHTPLLKKVKNTGKPIFLSTGMAEEDDLFKIYKLFGDYPLSLLHCVSLYPPKASELNLNIINRLSILYPDYIIGFSDHFPAYTSVISAVTLGARIIEKHFTLSNSLPGADHAISMLPDEFKKMVLEIKRLEKMLGSKIKVRQNSEKNAYKYGRRSIFCIKDIKKGQIITKEYIDFLRPGIGLKPEFFEKIENKKALRDINKNTPIKYGDF